MAPDELELLHGLLRHYARQLWDIQKERVGAGNRVAAMERDGLPPNRIETARQVVVSLEAIERAINAEVRSIVRQHPLAPWINAQRGIGLPGFANLLGVTGPLDRFRNVAKLWKYLGLHVVDEFPDGHAAKKVKGQSWTHTDCQKDPTKHDNDHMGTCPDTCTTDHHPNCVYGVLGTAYSPKGRTLCYMLGEAIVKVGGGGPYRAAYDRKKAEYEADRPAWPQMRRHRAAMRYSCKMLVKEMWLAWRALHREMTPAA